MKRIYLALVAAFLALGVNEVRADATIGTPITTSPFFISKPGKYRLTKNINHATGGAAISILTRDVVLDLNGFTINGLSAVTDGNIGISVSAPNAVIRNGIIRRFNTAVADTTTEAQGTILEDIVCIAQTSTGVRFASQDCILRRIVVRNTGTQTDNPSTIAGLFLTGSSILENCVVQNLPARDNVSNIWGIRLTGGSHVIRNCDVHDIAGSGLSVVSDRSTVIEFTRVRECIVGLAIPLNQEPLLRESTIRDCLTGASGTFSDGGRNSIE